MESQQRADLAGPWGRGLEAAGLEDGGAHRTFACGPDKSLWVAFRPSGPSGVAGIEQALTTSGGLHPGGAVAGVGELDGLDGPAASSCALDPANMTVAGEAA